MEKSIHGAPELNPKVLSVRSTNVGVLGLQRETCRRDPAWEPLSLSGRQQWAAVGSGLWGGAGAMGPGGVSGGLRDIGGWQPVGRGRMAGAHLGGVLRHPIHLSP